MTLLILSPSKSPAQPYADFAQAEFSQLTYQPPTSVAHRVLAEWTLGYHRALPFPA